MQSKTMLVIALAAVLLALPASAREAEPKPAQGKPATTQDREHAEKDAVAGSQQNKMKTCNVEAGKKNLKGDERRAFMSACLKG